MRNLPILSALLVLFCFHAFAAEAQEPRIGHSGYPVPRFVNLKNDETWGRVGPSFDYPIRYIFKRKNLPVKVIAETRDNVWRQIEDQDGIRTWIHRTQLVSTQMVIVTASSGTVMRKSPSREASGRARLEQGVILRAESCDAGWCQVSTSNYRGWVPQTALWGAE